MFFLLGILLMAGSAAFVGLLIADNLAAGPDYTVTLLGSQPFTMNTLGAFLSGLALALIFGFGLWLLFGRVLARRGRQKHRAARRDADQAARERDALASRLEEPEVRGAEGPEPARTGAVRSTGGRHRAGHVFRRPHRLHLRHH